MYKKLPQVTKYVDERLKGSNKQESALVAGYSRQTAETPSLIEHTQRYQEIITEVLQTNSESLRDVMHEYNEVIQTQPVDWVKAKQIIDVAEKQTKVYDILTPRVTVKTSTDSKGNTTRHVWGQNVAQLRDVIADKE